MSRLAPVEWSETAEDLYERFRREDDLERRKRLQVLWLVRRGEQIKDAAQMAGVAVPTACRWLSWYRLGGVENVLRRLPRYRSTGRRNRLTPIQKQMLLDRWASGAFQTYDEARAWVRVQFGVEYRHHGMYSILRRLGMRTSARRAGAPEARAAAS